jgi:hypothetical protein
MIMVHTQVIYSRPYVIYLLVVKWGNVTVTVPIRGINHLPKDRIGTDEAGFAPKQGADPSHGYKVFDISVS